MKGALAWCCLVAKPSQMPFLYGFIFVENTLALFVLWSYQRPIDFPLNGVPPSERSVLRVLEFQLFIGCKAFKNSKE